MALAHYLACRPFCTQQWGPLWDGVPAMPPSYIKAKSFELPARPSIHRLWPPSSLQHCRHPLGPSLCPLSGMLFQSPSLTSCASLLRCSFSGDALIQSLRSSAHSPHSCALHFKRVLLLLPASPHWKTSTKAGTGSVFVRTWAHHLPQQALYLQASAQTPCMAGWLKECCGDWLWLFIPVQNVHMRPGQGGFLTLWF